MGALAGFAPRIAHQIGSLDLVEDLIVAEYGLGCVNVVPLADPTVVLTAYAVTRTGRATRSPLRVALDRLRPSHRDPAAPELAAPLQVQVHQSASHRRAKQPS